MVLRAEATETSAYAFLFNTTDADVPDTYGESFMSAFLVALEQADPQGETSSSVLTGDLLFPRVAASEAWKPFLVGVAPGGVREIAPRVFASTLVLDCEQPDLFSRSRLISAHKRGEILYSITVERIQPLIAGRLHTCMLSTEAYVGAVHIEKQEGHVRALLIDELIDTAWVQSGLLTMDPRTKLHI